MQRKLQCILVDDDPVVHNIFREYLENNEYAEVTDYYEDPVEFINSKKKPDLVFIDIVMPYVNGFELAKSIAPTPVILFTGRIEYFKDIMGAIYAIDAFSKPIEKERLLKSVKNAFILLNTNKHIKGYKLFHTDGGQVNILLTDILFVKTIKNSHRYLEAYLKGDRKFVLKGYSLEFIQNIARFLLQSNRGELVSPEAIGLIEHNSKIILCGVTENGKSLYSPLLLGYRKNFLAQLYSA